MTNPDPIVEDILLDTIEDEEHDDGMYMGWDRIKYCHRCIRLGHTDPEPGIPSKIEFPYCDRCVQELDNSKSVRAIMRTMRRHSKPKF